MCQAQVKHGLQQQPNTLIYQFSFFRQFVVSVYLTEDHNSKPQPTSTQNHLI